MKDEREGTLTHDGGRAEAERARAPQAMLVAAMDCARPGLPPARVLLGQLDRLHLGRGAARVTQPGERDRELTLLLPDRWMSTAHARLERRFGRWFVDDGGSKNGTQVNGARATTQELVDGDVVVVGHTLLLYRDAVVVPDDEPVFLDLAEGDDLDDGTTTLVPALTSTFEGLARIAATDLSVLVEGESGTGKELLARAIHRRSGRRGELVAVNCGAIAPTLFESELFGHRKGAFSGALENRPGLVRAADGGTLFLDEIADLPAGSQSALLRVLQEREVLPVGETRPVPVDVRVVAATHRDLAGMVARGAFRHDLYARLVGHRVELLPLRERREDLGLLVGLLLQRQLGSLDGHPGFEPAAALQLFAQRWPLNIRELESALKSASALAGERAIAPEHLPPPARPATAAPAAELDAADAARRALLVEKLRAHGGNVSAVARELGEHRRQVQRWVQRYRITPAEYTD